MRVIAGDFKGRKLVSPKGTDVRPTSDRVKEAIFSMVQPALPGATCLDLFAGTGALGIEALSRGARRVYFCDNADMSLAAVRQNLDACRVEGPRAAVMKADWRASVKNIEEKCNIVFIDAPYHMCEHYSEILKTLAVQGLLTTGALVALERDAGMGGYLMPAGFERIREKRYGGVGVDLLVYTEGGTTE